MIVCMRHGYSTHVWWKCNKKHQVVSKSPWSLYNICTKKRGQWKAEMDEINRKKNYKKEQKKRKICVECRRMICKCKWWWGVQGSIKKRTTKIDNWIKNFDGSWYLLDIDLKDDAMMFGWVVNFTWVNDEKYSVLRWIDAVIDNWWEESLGADDVWWRMMMITC